MTARTLIAVAMLLISAPAFGETPFDQWLQSKLPKAAAANNAASPAPPAPAGGAADSKAAAKAAVAQAAQDPANKATAGESTTKQTQSISVDHGSTTFVDQSNGADLVSTAFNLLPVSSGSASGQSGSGTVTASLYGVYTLAASKDPLLPSVYNRYAALRTVFFTLGREQQNTTDPGSGGSSGGSSAGSVTTPAGTIYGAQWTIVNRRDATNIANDPKAMKTLADFAEAHATAATADANGLRNLLCPQTDRDKKTECENEFTTTAKIDAAVEKLSKEQQLQLDQIVKDYTDTINNLSIDGIIQALQHRTQMSLNFQTTQRSATSPDDYSAEFILDRGFGTGWLLTFNGSYNYSNSALKGADLRTERGAFEISRNLVQASGNHQKSPLQLNLAAQGLRQNNDWHYQAQLQLVVPVATGVNLPLSFGYSDQVDVLRQQEKGVYGKFGLTFDFAKILAALRPQKERN